MNLNPTYRWQVFDDLKSITRPHMWDMVEVSWTRDELRANICVQVCQATFLCLETEPVGTTVDGISRQHLAWEAVKLRTKQINTKTKQLANLLLLFNLNMAAIAFFPLFGSGIINSSSTRKQNHFGINNQPFSRWRTCIVCEFSQENMGDHNSSGDPYKCCKLYLQSWTKMKVKNDHRSRFSNLSNWKEEAWKKSGLQRDWKIYCDDHSSLSSTTAVQNELFHILHMNKNVKKTGRYHV